MSQPTVEPEKIIVGGDVFYKYTLSDRIRYTVEPCPEAGVEFKELDDRGWPSDDCPRITVPCMYEYTASSPGKRQGEHAWSCLASEANDPEMFARLGVRVSSLVEGDTFKELALATERWRARPRVGNGATVVWASDRTACTIIASSEKQITVQEDKATRTDDHGMSDSQSYTYERNADGRTWTFTLRKNGKWTEKGHPIGKGLCLRIGSRSEFFNFSH